MINNLKISMFKNLDIKKESKELKKNEKVIKSNTINIESTKEDAKNIRLTLVEEIEEFGFIPSIDKKKNSNAA